MIKTFSDRTCAFDCEWVPCPDTARRLLKLPAACSDREAMAAMWKFYGEKDAQRYGKEPKPDERPFLKFVLSKVVTIAAVVRSVGRTGAIHLELYSRRVDARGEGPLIAEFLELVAQSQWQLWGFNSAGADIPLLKQRAIALGVPCPLFSKRPNKPWEGMDYHDARNSDAHMDILDLFGGFSGAAKPSLNELAVACGFPGKLEVAGDDVAEMYLEGRLGDIAEYNETDAVTTHLVMLRIGLHSGFLTPEAYQHEVDAVEALVCEQIAKEKAQFVNFLAVWQG